MRKKLLVVALMVAIAISFIAYAWATRDEGARAEKNQETPSDVTKFKAVVNGMRSIDVFVCVNMHALSNYCLLQCVGLVAE